jgi:hypothetical protein
MPGELPPARLRPSWSRPASGRATGSAVNRGFRRRGDGLSRPPNAHGPAQGPGPPHLPRSQKAGPSHKTAAPDSHEGSRPFPPADALARFTCGFVLPYERPPARLPPSWSRPASCRATGNAVTAECRRRGAASRPANAHDPAPSRASPGAPNDALDGGRSRESRASGTTPRPDTTADATTTRPPGTRHREHPAKGLKPGGSPVPREQQSTGQSQDPHAVAHREHHRQRRTHATPIRHDSGRVHRGRVRPDRAGTGPGRVGIEQRHPAPGLGWAAQGWAAPGRAGAELGRHRLRQGRAAQDPAEAGRHRGAP